MELNDLDNITVTSKNVAQLASIAIELKLPEDTPLRQNLKKWYDENSPANMRINSQLKAIQEMLNYRYSLNYIAKKVNVGNKTIAKLIKEGKVTRPKPLN